MKVLAVTLGGLMVVLAIALLLRLQYDRAHCQEIYGSNPWTGGGNANTPWWCRTAAEDRRIKANEQQAARNGAQAYQ